MFEALDITEADVAGLNECAAADLELMRVFKTLALAEDDPELKVKFARTAQRHLRSYRQDILLKARLKRELQRAVAEAREPDPGDEPLRPPVSPARLNRLSDRAMDLIGAARKVAWAEYVEVEGLDGERNHGLADYLGELETWVAQASVKPGFAERPLDDHVGDLCRELSLDPGLSARWRDLPEPPEAPFEPPPAKPRAPGIPNVRQTEANGFWKPEGWKPGDVVYYIPPKPRPP